MKTVSISTRELTIFYTIDQLSADQISNKLNEQYQIHSTGDEVAELLRERGVTKRAKRTIVTPLKDYKFTDPDGPQDILSENESTGYVNMSNKVQLEEAN